MRVVTLGGGNETRNVDIGQDFAGSADFAYCNGREQSLQYLVTPRSSITPNPGS